MMFKAGFDASSLPPETCSNTTSEQFMLNVDASQGWAAFHLVNAAAVSRLSVSLDGHSMIVYAADGLYVEPQTVEVSSGTLVSNFF
jgi:FtsP/CotA-like multicopper oxidase with cupredoxin domain